MEVEPQLFVTDMTAALDFYRDRLGFRVAFVHGEPVFYAQVVRGGVRLNLRAVDEPALSPAFRAANPDALCITLTVEAAAPLYREFEAAGATFHQPLRREPWGAETFILNDPSGNLICVAGASNGEG